MESLLIYENNVWRLDSTKTGHTYITSESLGLIKQWAEANNCRIVTRELAKISFSTTLSYSCVMLTFLCIASVVIFPELLDFL
jgi:hypothetical protein